MRHQRRGARLPRPRHRQPGRPHQARGRRRHAGDGVSARMTILFWDIDGTLLTTGKAGVPAWEAAVREVTGLNFELSSIRVPGLTDFQIAVRTFELLEFTADDATLRRMVRRYEELLPSTLPSRQGRV